MTAGSDGKRIVAAAATTWLVSIPVGAFIHNEVFGAAYAGECRGVQAGSGYCPETDGWLCRSTGRISGRRAPIYAAAPRASWNRRRVALRRADWGRARRLAAVWNYVTLPISPAAGVSAAAEYVVPSILYRAIIGAIERRRR
jgi:hypothetical protein